MLPDALAFAIMTAAALLSWLSSHCATQFGCVAISGPAAGGRHHRRTSAVPMGPVLP